MSEGHDAGQTPQDHGHEHPRHELSYHAKRIYAIRDLLLEKGVITDKDIQRQVEYQEARSPANGAKLVARAWVDPAFKARLIGDPKAACAEMGIDATSINEFVVLENTEKVRHMVVCTLCSCYPRPILGRPPDLPLRPKGTGRLSETELAQLVTRDSMIGVMDALPAVPPS